MTSTRDEHVLAIDVGTQSVRALVFDAEGTPVAKSQQPIQPYRSPRPGWAEQDAGWYWQVLTEVCQHLWSDTEAEPARIRGMAVTVQRATVVVCDGSGEPLRPAIVWLDQRRCRAPPPMSPVWRGLAGLAGAGGVVDRLRERAVSNWLAEHEPGLWSRVRCYGLLSAYLHCCLTGAWRDAVACQVGYLPFDYRRQAWAGQRDWRWQALGLGPEMLPELVGQGERLGGLTSTAAAAIGLPAGLPVVAAAADKACEVLGSGGLLADTACLSFGTTATVNITTRRYFEPTRWLPAYPAAVAGAYNAEVQIFRGFWLVSWFLRELPPFLAPAPHRAGEPPAPRLEALLEATPPGADGLLSLPYWSPGVVEPGPEARGAWIGFDDRHTRAHVYRALLEGLAYGLRAGAERLTRRGRMRIRRLRLAGGGSQSEAVCQLVADCFGLPATRAHTHEAAALGAAVNAAVGLGLHPDHASAVAAMCHDGQRFEPRTSAAAHYDRVYAQVYRRLYPALRPIYRRLGAMPGPE